VKVLFCFVNPADRPAFDDESLWDQINDEIGADANGSFAPERLLLPTEPALTQKLAEDQWDVLHVVAVAPERDAHGTVPLLSSDKRPRNLSLKYFASLVAPHPSVKLVVLHSAVGAKQSFSNSAKELVELGLPAVVAVPTLKGHATRSFISALYEELASGSAPDALTERFATLGKQAGNESLGSVEIHAKDTAKALFTSAASPKKRAARETHRPNIPAACEPATEREPPIYAPEAPAPQALPTPLRGAAFLSYCRADSTFALRLAEDLKASGADVWIDQLDIAPGTLWDRAVQTALSQRQTVLVVLSPSSSCSENVLDEVSYAIEKKKRVLPILYRECDVPLRLARLQYIDFRNDYNRALNILLYALGKGAQPATGA
jgi:hypothetical protein